MLLFEIPGKPFSQPRPKASAFRLPGGAVRGRVYNPAAAVQWKAQASAHLAQQARLVSADLPLFTGSVSVVIRAFYGLPKGRRLKRGFRERDWRHGGHDLDNVAKAVLDAAGGVLWLDDSAVVELLISKVRGNQDEAPRVEIEVGEAPALGCAMDSELVENQSSVEDLA